MLIVLVSCVFIMVYKCRHGKETADIETKTNSAYGTTRPPPLPPSRDYSKHYRPYVSMSGKSDNVYDYVINEVQEAVVIGQNVAYSAHTGDMLMSCSDEYEDVI